MGHSWYLAISLKICHLIDIYLAELSLKTNLLVKHDLDIALSSGIQLGIRNSLLIKNNESFSKHVCQLKDEAREFKNEINQKEISLASAKSEIATKLEEIQALQSKVEELEQDVSLVQKRLSEMDFLKCKSELEYIKLSDENISLK
jgi:predicted nuclease with TOPRIM domain